MPQKSKETWPGSFFFGAKGQNPQNRRAAIRSYLKNTHQVDDQELVRRLKCLWSISMINPTNEESPTSRIFKHLSGLIIKCLKDRKWLFMNQNMYIPYYAAHIIGSLTINNAKSALEATNAGVMPPLLELLRGKISWVEQRVAVRALGHLASYGEAFAALAIYEQDIVNLAMHLASTCAEIVYKDFVGIKDQNKRLKYHRDLLTKGFEDLEVENQKAEEWAGQLQCWCLHLLNCFAIKKRSLNIICKAKFLKDLCGMHGGISNRMSPAGIGLIRILCYSKIGRKKIAKSGCVMQCLCNLSRSSDDWQYMGIDCLLLLLKDPGTRYKVIEIAIFCLKDLIELRNIGGRSHVGEVIIKTIFTDLKLRDDQEIKNNDIKEALKEMWNFKMNKAKGESITNEDIKKVAHIKREGNSSFQLGKIKEAMLKFSEALEICPLSLKKERMILYSKRAQCHLLQRDHDAAISDTTRALCISKPPNSHRNSLWRRSRAYDMKGLAKESLTDCIMFITCCFKSEGKKQVKIPYQAVRMICKQMDATWIFKCAQLKELDCSEENARISASQSEIKGKDQHVNETMKICTHSPGFMASLSTILEEPRTRNGGSSRRRLRKLETVEKPVFVV